MFQKCSQLCDWQERLVTKYLPDKEGVSYLRNNYFMEENDNLSSIFKRIKNKTFPVS